MYHVLLRDASFWLFLFGVDEIWPGRLGSRDARVAGDCTVPTTRASHGWMRAVCRNRTTTA